MATLSVHLGLASMSSFSKTDPSQLLRMKSLIWKSLVEVWTELASPQAKTWQLITGKDNTERLGKLSLWWNLKLCHVWPVGSQVEMVEFVPRGCPVWQIPKSRGFLFTFRVSCNNCPGFAVCCLRGEEVWDKTRVPRISYVMGCSYECVLTVKERMDVRHPS